MKLQSNEISNIYLIHGFDEKTIEINQTRHTSSLIITPNKLIADWPVRSCADLTQAVFSELLELAPKILLLGTGTNIEFPDQAVRIPLYEAGIGLEVMDTHAACRTYNILANEGRTVVAALMLPTAPTA